MDDYVHLKDAMNHDVDAKSLGKMVILPLSHVGSPRHMHEYTQDALAYVRIHGCPGLFVTFTCNPLWQEIKDNLYQGQSATDRHDIIARVFKLKLKSLVKTITQLNIFWRNTLLDVHN